MAGDLLYGRRCRLTLTPNTGTSIEVNAISDGNEQGLRVTFQITKTRDKSPNTAEIKIYNLTEKTRLSLQVKPLTVELEAGYQESGLARLFKGDARTIDHERKGCDWITTIKCGDGERNMAISRVQRSFGAKTTAGQVLKQLAADLGVAVGNVPTVIADMTTVFDAGYVCSGRVKDELDRLCKSLGYEWSVQDGALQVLVRNSYVGGMIPLIDSDSGLIGSPESGSPEKKGQAGLVRFKCLLTPLVVGGKVKLKSLRYDGDLVIKRVKYDGDTMGGNWFVEVEGAFSSG